MFEGDHLEIFKKYGNLLVIIPDREKYGKYVLVLNTI